MSHKYTNILIATVSVVIALLLSTTMGDFYNNFFQVGLGGNVFGDESFWELVLGFPLALIFSFTLLFSAFGKGNWQKWLIWSLAIPGLFELIFDFSHLYFPIVLGLLGYGLGWVVRWLLSQVRT